MTGIISDIGKIMVFLLILLSIFLYTTKSKNKLPNKLFASFLLVTSLDFTGLFLSDFFNKYPYLKHVKIASVLIQMPLFYLYVKAVCYHNFKLKLQHLFHSVLFFAFLILFFIVGISRQSYSLYEVIAQLQYYGYIIGVFYTLRRYKTLNLENYSFNNQSYQWLTRTTVLFLIGNSFVLFRTLYENTQRDEALLYINFGITLFALSVICWFVLKTMYSPEIFLGIDKNLKSIEKSVIEDKEKYTEELNRLSKYMASNKPYLESMLTLQSLSKKTNIPEKHLSFLINRIAGRHFFDYINDYRIREAKALLKDQPELTVQEIMYQVGFNSKSSFYTEFKKSTHQTPTAYRKSST